jgi:hypothetical protein
MDQTFMITSPIQALIGYKMTINWIVEKNLFPEYEERLVKSIRDSGATCYFFDDSFYNFDFVGEVKKRFKPEDAVIFYGSLQNGLKMYNQTAFTPGVYLTKENYECFKYYGNFGNELLNSDYMMMGLNDLYRRKTELIENHKDKFFIRPSNGYKTFPGQVFHTDEFDKEFNLLTKSYGGLDMDQLVVVSPYRKITNESRFAVIDGEIVDGCIYMIDGEKITVHLWDQLAYEYANKVKYLYSPDDAYTLDIAFLEDTREYKVIEVNSLCCAGLYQMEVEKVVKKMNKMVEKTYKDFWQS